ncbi:MAG: hypothetical protein H6Q90_4878 [Deltaproteobacteria bacterium]|nr:hypothetical protein [Deltaproteobacteria bacterium]
MAPLIRFVPLFTFLLVAACSDGGSTIGPGPQTHVPTTPPPPSSPTTSVTCSASDPCDFWFCQCADDAVVNSAFCNQGLCSEASAICPEACTAFGHGAWTGVAGGGPGQPPQPSSCGGLGSSTQSCDTCFEAQCCTEGKACGDDPSCLDHWDCVVGCNGDGGCRAACDDTADPTGRAHYEALEACLLSDCGDVCGG